MTASATRSRWSRRYVLAGVVWLCVFQTASLLGAPRSTVVTVGLFGFVFHVVFGKAYALIPAYFETDLAFGRGPAIQFPLVVAGTAGLAAAPLGGLARASGTAGAVLWLLGIVVFVATLAATIAGPLVRGATGTGEHNADRRPVDRLANGFVPVVLLYLLVGSYETAAGNLDVLPTVLGSGIPASATHLLAAGAATLLVFAVGFRLVPRFFGGQPSRWTAAVVLVAGAIAPVLLAAGFGSGYGDSRLFVAGAIAQTVAVVVFAAVVLAIGWRSDRRWVGLYGICAGVCFGVVGVLLGVHFAFAGVDPATVPTHVRVNLLGFLGLTVVGVSLQFYPPAVGTFPGSGDRTAAAAIAAIAVGLAFEAVVVVAGIGPTAAVTSIGRTISLLGVVAYGYLLVGVFLARR